MGTFNVTVNGINFHGGLTYEVTQVNGQAIQLLGTFTYGGFCDPTRGCRTPGVSQYYLSGTVLGQQLVAMPSAWAAITDRSFPQQSISGFLASSGQSATFSGYYGSGSFNTTLACSAASGLIIV